MKILSFGEILWDVFPDKKYIGGASLNFAAHMAKHGQQTYMLSALGEDDLGKEALEQLDALGVSCKYVSNIKDKQTGKCVVTLDENLIPSYNLLNDVAYDYISCDNLPDDFDVLYFGTLATRNEHNFNCVNGLIKTNNFKEIFVDVNIRAPFYSKKQVELCVKNATILKISLEELETISQLLEMADTTDYKAFSKELIKNNSNLKCIIITLGSDGAYAMDTLNNKEFSCGVSNVKVVSTVGAGDSFSAAFLHQYLSGRDVQFCLEYASKVAGFVVSNTEAVPDYSISDFN